MTKQPSPSPRAGAFRQLTIASVECLSRCQALWDGGRSSPQKSRKQRPQEAGGLAGGRGPTSGRRSSVLRQEADNSSIQTLAHLRNSQDNKMPVGGTQEDFYSNCNLS